MWQKQANKQRKPWLWNWLVLKLAKKNNNQGKKAKDCWFYPSGKSKTDHKYGHSKSVHLRWILVYQNGSLANQDPYSPTGLCTRFYLRKCYYNPHIIMRIMVNQQSIKKNIWNLKFYLSWGQGGRVSGWNVEQNCFGDKAHSQETSLPLTIYHVF